MYDAGFFGPGVGGFASTYHSLPVTATESSDRCMWRASYAVQQNVTMVWQTFSSTAANTSSLHPTTTAVARKASARQHAMPRASTLQHKHHVMLARPTSLALNTNSQISSPLLFMYTAELARALTAAQCLLKARSTSGAQYLLPGMPRAFLG